MSTKDEITTLLKSIDRPGMDSLIGWLETTDFFTAPSSTKYHGNYPGGLADHCLNVYDSLVLLHSEYVEKEKSYSEDTIKIAALLHDLCKINYYHQDDDPATNAQISYMSDLLSKCGEESPIVPKEYQTKSYVSKVIDYLKNGGESFPKYSPSYKVKDDLPIGHGEKSVFLIQRSIDLTEEEALAIRWHLGGMDPGFHFFFPTGAPMQQAIREVPLVSLLIAADFLATWQVDITK